MTEKRYIEESFPVKEVSAESSREKNIRHGIGSISTIHSNPSMGVLSDR